jgi:hypothetical protein
LMKFLNMSVVASRGRGRFERYRMFVLFV